MSALLLPNEILSMTAAAARRLVEAGDGDCALLYLALLDAGGDDGKAGQRLRWPEDRLGRAYGRLAELGLAEGRPQGRPEPSKAAERLPEYNRSDIMDAMEREPEFMGLYREVERLLNRTLTDNDLKCLYTIYDFLALPVEVILLLTGHVVQTARRQRGGSQERLSVRMPQVQKAAFRWKRLGIDTVERAEDYLRRQQLVDQREWEILSAVGVTERRAAVEKEREFIEQWVELELSDELIHMAYERTVYQKGAMSWPYVNKILLSWSQAGYRTPEQVRAGDKRPQRRPAQKEAAGEKNYQPSRERIQKNADWLDRFLEEQKKGG